MKGKKAMERKKNRFIKWIENRRKRNQRKYIMTKPSMKRIFAKYLAASLCVAMILCYFGTIALVSEYRSDRESAFNNHYNRVEADIKQSYHEIMSLSDVHGDKLEVWKSEIQYRMNEISGLYNRNYAIALYNEDTKELLVENADVISIVLFENRNLENERELFYTCSRELLQDVLNDYDEHEKELLKEGKLIDDAWVGVDYLSITIQDIYIKGGEFLPGKVVLEQQDHVTDEITVVKEYDYTPADTSGYDHVVVEGDDTKRILGPLRFDLSQCEEAKTILQDYTDEDGRYGVNMWEHENLSPEEVLFWGNVCIQHNDLVIDNTLNLKLVMVAKTDIWEEYGMWNVIPYAVVLLLTIFFSFALAYRTYMVRLNHYQLDTYRRETTNAMAHDLKTPLTAISGYAENLRNNVHSEKKDYYADIILEHVQYMNEMVSNILELAKVENTNWMPHKESLDLKAETQDILKKYEILTVDKNLKVSVEGECVIQADGVRMVQALENLVGNAIKYAANGTMIYVKMDKDFYEVRNIIDGQLEVSAEELWKPFIKGDNSRNEQRGTGVGLTIVKNIADVHGFELVLQCEEQEFVARIVF